MGKCFEGQQWRLTSTLTQHALAAWRATMTFSLRVSSSIVIVLGSIWQNVNKGISWGYTCKTKSNFLGVTNSPRDLLDRVPAPAGRGPEEYLLLVLWVEKCDFFQRRNGVTLRSTSIEWDGLNGEAEVIFNFWNKRKYLIRRMYFLALFIWSAKVSKCLL